MLVKQHFHREFRIEKLFILRSQHHRSLQTQGFCIVRFVEDAGRGSSQIRFSVLVFHHSHPPIRTAADCGNLETGSYRDTCRSQLSHYIHIPITKVFPASNHQISPYPQRQGRDFKIHASLKTIPIDRIIVHQFHFPVKFQTAFRKINGHLVHIHACKIPILPSSFFLYFRIDLHPEFPTEIPVFLSAKMKHRIEIKTYFLLNGTYGYILYCHRKIFNFQLIIPT